MLLQEQPATDSSKLSSGALNSRRCVRWAILGALMLLGASARLYRIDAPGVLIDREYTSAIIARDYFFDHSSAVEPWRKELARVTREKQPALEPPVTEWLVSLIYRLVGREQLAFAHVLTSGLWVVGAIFLYVIVVSLCSAEAALFAAAYYLLCPLGILVSRSFQADSLMMLLFLVSLLGVVRYHEHPTMGRLLWTGGIAGLAVLYRPLILFALLGAYIVPVFQRRGLRGLVSCPHSLLFLGISVLPAVAFYGYGTFIAGHFGWKLKTSFQPWLLGHGEFWKGWWTLAVNAMGYPVLGAALVSAPMLRRGLPRAVMVGLAAGYGVFGLLFTMHIHTHGYYHAQLIPMAALAIGPLVTLIVTRLRQSVDRWWWWLGPAALLLLLCLGAVRDVRAELGRQHFESPAVARQIGEIVNHSTRVVFLAPYYGMPLQYFGEFTGAYWPRSVTFYLQRRGEPELSVNERLKRLGFVPTHFVITSFGEFKRNHADLQAYLTQHWMLIADTKDYLIYRPR